MAQPTSLSVRAVKIVSPDNKIVFDGGSTTAGTTKDVCIVLAGGTAFITAVPARTGSTSTNDTLIVTSLGYQITIIQEYADVLTALSATDITAS